MSEENRDPGSDLDAGLEAAFGAPEERGASILKRIERLTGIKSQLILHDAPGEESPLTYVHRLSRDDEGAEDDSRYQIAGEIAKGGVGVVYKGRDRDLGRDVALKVLRKTHAGNPEVFHRFVEEAQIGGQLQHPGIVPVYSLGLQPDGRPSFAMKLVKGKTLAAALKERKSPADGRRSHLRNFERICQTMAYAHARGVIHRDLKPSNVMLGAFGEVLVVDWGFGKVLGRPEPEKPEVERTVVTTVRSDSEGSASIAGSVMGTPAYMPPEQALGHVADLDEQTDVFALGAILTEILTGKPPYVGEPKDLLVMASQARLDDALERLESCDADPEVTALAKRCLEPMRSDRPVNAGEVAEEIGRLLTQAEERAHAAEIDAVRERSREKQAKNHAQWERRAKKLTIGLAAAILLAIIAGGGFFLNEDAKQRERTAKVRPKLEQAIEEVSRLSGQGKWAEALAVAKKAGHLAADLDDATRDQAAQLLLETEAGRAATEAEAAQLQKDNAFLDELEGIWLERADTLKDPRLTVRQIEEAFSRYGLDPVETPPEEFGERVRARGPAFAGALADYLTSWANLAQVKRELADTDTDLPVRLASACDPDSVRAEIQALTKARDAEGLIALASDESTIDLPTRTLHALGRSLQVVDRIEEAARLLEAACRKHPGDYWLHTILGSVLRDLDRPEDSLRHQVATVAIRPDSAMAHSNLGALLHDELHEYVRAEEEFRTVMRLAPGTYLGPLYLGNALRSQDRLDEAVVAFREAIRMAADAPGPRNNLGGALSRQGKLEDALECYTEAARLRPDKGMYHHNRGASLAKLGRHDQARAAYEEAVRVEPTYAASHMNLGNIAMRRGEGNVALDHLMEAVRLDPGQPIYHFNLGTVLHGLGQVEEAIASFERAIEVDATYWQAYANLGVALEKVGRDNEAFEVFQEAVRINPESPQTLTNLAIALKDRGRLDEALKLYLEARELEPYNPIFLLNLANTLYAKGRFEEALATFEKALLHRPDYAKSYNGLGMTLHAMGKIDEAIAAYRRAIRIQPDSASTYTNLAISLKAAGRTEAAFQAFQEAVRRAPNEPVFLGNLAKMLSENGRFEEAVTHYRKLLRLAPTNAVAANNLGLCFLQLGRGREAAEALREAIRRDPDYALAHKNLGFLYAQLGLHDEGLKAYREAARLDPDDPRVQFGLGTCLLHEGLCEEAVTPLRKATELEPTHAAAHCNLGHALWRLGRYEEALPAMRKGHAIGSRRPGWPNPSAEWIALLEKTAALEKRLPAILRGEDQPADARERLLLAEMLHHREDYARSARFYAEALAENPDLARLEYHRSNAAHNAAVAGTREALETPEGAAWRRRALDWLRADLTWRRESPSARELIEVLTFWLRDGDYAGVRDEAGLAKLPEEEREAWQAFWEDVKQALEKARGED